MKLYFKSIIKRMKQLKTCLEIVFILATAHSMVCITWNSPTPFMGHFSLKLPQFPHSLRKDMTAHGHPLKTIKGGMAIALHLPINLQQPPMVPATNSNAILMVAVVKFSYHILHFSTLLTLDFSFFF